jgi:hypothetical protein
MAHPLIRFDPAAGVERDGGDLFRTRGGWPDAVTAALAKATAKVDAVVASQQAAAAA